MKILNSNHIAKFAIKTSVIRLSQKCPSTGRKLNKPALLMSMISTQKYEIIGEGVLAMLGLLVELYSNSKGYLKLIFSRKEIKIAFFMAKFT